MRILKLQLQQIQQTLLKEAQLMINLVKNIIHKEFLRVINIII